MKLRMKGNSIRLRLTRPEVARLVAGEPVRETTQFGSANFFFSIVATDSCKRIIADFDGAEIAVVIPASVASDWAASEKVSLRATDGSVDVLIEKDLACLDRREEDADAFPNPAACGG